MLLANLSQNVELLLDLEATLVRSVLGNMPDGSGPVKFQTFNLGLEFASGSLLGPTQSMEVAQSQYDPEGFQVEWAQKEIEFVVDQDYHGKVKPESICQMIEKEDSRMIFKDGRYLLCDL